MCEVPVSLVIQRLQGLRREGHFREWSLDDIERVGTHCPVVSYQTGDTLFSRGEVSLWFGCILEGKCESSITGSDMNLGMKTAGSWIGTSRALTVPNNHLRPYNLRVLEGGFLLWVTYRTFFGFEQSNPPLFYALSYALHAAQLEYSANFFTGHPFTPKWNNTGFSVRRILDLFTRYRDRKLIFTYCDDAALLGLAARVRTVSFQAAECLQSRGSPCFLCYIILMGNVAVFDDPAQGPSRRLQAGACFGIDSLVAPYALCPSDVFASTPTVVAMITPQDIRCMGQENPSSAAHILNGLVNASIASRPVPSAALLSESQELHQRGPGDVVGLHEVTRLHNAAQVQRYTESIDLREGKGFLGGFASKKTLDSMMTPKRRARSFSPKRVHVSVRNSNTVLSNARSRAVSAERGWVADRKHWATDTMPTMFSDGDKAPLQKAVSPRASITLRPSTRERLEGSLRRPLSGTERRKDYLPLTPAERRVSTTLGDEGRDEGYSGVQRYFDGRKARFPEEYRKNLLKKWEKCADVHKADLDNTWNLLGLKQDEEAKFLWHEVDILAQENRRLTLNLAQVTKERDEWKAKALKGKMNSEFQEQLTNFKFPHNSEVRLSGGRLQYK